MQVFVGDVTYMTKQLRQARFPELSRHTVGSVVNKSGRARAHWRFGKRNKEEIGETEQNLL